MRVLCAKNGVMFCGAALVKFSIKGRANTRPFFFLRIIRNKLVDFPVRLSAPEGVSFTQ